MAASFKVLVLTVLLFAVAFGQTDLDRAVELYQTGNTKNSIALLEKITKADKTNAKAWNFLGLNYMKAGNSKKAKDAFKKAVKYDPNEILYLGNLAMFFISEGDFEDAEDRFEDLMKLTPKDANGFYYRGTAKLYSDDWTGALDDANKAVSLNPKLAQASTLKMDASLTMLISEAQSQISEPRVREIIGSSRLALARCLEECPDSSKDQVRDKLESLGAFEGYLLRKAGVDTSAGEAEGEKTEMKVLTKPRPGYTDRARYGNESGQVVLLVEFKSNGKIGYVAVLEGLRYGLTERAIRAARGIQFEPVKIDGVPQTVLRSVHFNFTIY